MSKRGAQLFSFPFYSLNLFIFLCISCGIIAALSALSLVSLPLVHADAISLITYNNVTGITRNQDLEYMTCIDGAHTFGFTQLICNDNAATIPATATPLSDSCEYTTINLADSATPNCNDYTIESYYTKNGDDKKVSQIITTNTVLAAPTFILNAQSWDGGWGGAANTAFAIWVLSGFGDAYRAQITDGMNWLKDNRQNNPKCWVNAAGECSPGETIKALAYLKLANISDGNRIVSDGMAYVESLQKYIANPTWAATVTATQDNTICNLTADGATIVDDVILNDSQVISAPFTANYGTILNMTCSDQANLALTDNRGVQKFSYTFDVDSASNFDDGLFDDTTVDTSTLPYHIVRIQQPCWSVFTSQWSSCDAEVTAYALSLGTNSAQQAAGRTWLESTLQNNSVIGKFLSTPDVARDSAFYLMTVEPTNTDILDWLIYSQNNDGSFGSGSTALQIEDTAAAYLALQKESFPQKAEVLADAAHWMSTAYTARSTGNVQVDGSLFQLLSLGSQPYLQASQPGVVMLKNSEQKTVDYKPVGAREITGLQYSQYSIDGNPATDLSVSGPASISGNETLSVTLQGKDTTAGNASGYISISGLVDNETASRELRRIYYIITRDPLFSIKANESTYNAYDNSFNYLFSVDAINVPVVCDVQIQSPQLIGPKQVRITSVGTFELPITVHDISDGDAQGVGTLVCDRAGTQVIVPFNIDAQVHSSIPFSVSPSSITITKYTKSFSVTVKNLVNQPMDVSADLLAPSELYVIEPYQTTVDGKGSVTIDFSTTFLAQENVSDSNAIEVSAYGKTIEVPLTITIAYAPSSLAFIIWFTLGITLIATAGYVAYNWKDYGPQFKGLYAKYRYGKGSGKTGGASGSYSSSGGSVMQFKKKDKDVARATMMDIISIMKSMDKSEPEIIAKLESEGYARPMIEGLILELNEVQQRVSTIKHEDTILGIIHGLDAEMDVMTKVLKDKGFSENDIREALKELSTDTDSKEKKLRAEAGFSDNEKIS